MKLLTWNVLHRVHAERFDEPVIARWPDEAARIDAVVHAVDEALRDCSVALLQEVSGDLLIALQAHLPRWTVLNHLYPRLPKPKRPMDGADISEHLVVIGPEGTQVVRSETFESDDGKGFLMATLPSGVSVVSTHVSWGDRREAQLARLGEVLRACEGPMVVGGDFNAEREVVERALGREVAVSVAPEHTRPGTGEIDFLVARGARLEGVEVVDVRGVSDHLAVRAAVT